MSSTPQAIQANSHREVAGSLLVVDNVRKTYQRPGSVFQALADINLTLPAGSFQSIVGASGCGKSTLLSIIAGLMPASSGTVLVADQPLARPRAELVTLIFQDPTLLPWLTALDNVAFPLELRGISRPERRDRAEQLLQLVGLAEFAHHYPRELSGGMRQRVAIARGLVLDPAVLLMDEPFGALDEQTRIRLGDELLSIWERTRKTILFVTHSLSEAIYLSDRVFVLHGRPSRIAEVLDIALPRPRNLSIMGSPEFGRLRNQIWNYLSQE